jgi:proteic killer suppression protein
MIRSFKSKGLKELFEKRQSRKVATDLQARSLRRLDILTVAKRPEQMAFPGFNFHALKGKPQRYTVHVNGPWCITFGWDGEDAIDVDLEQYH